MRERIYVIGSNSYTGAAFIEYCLEQGLEIQGCSRSAELATPFLPYKWENTGKAAGSFEFAKLDLNHDTKAIAERIKEFAPEMVVNFAAQRHGGGKLGAPGALVRDECGGECAAA